MRPMYGNETITQLSLNDVVSLLCFDWFPPPILRALASLYSSVCMHTEIIVSSMEGGHWSKSISG